MPCAAPSACRLRWSSELQDRPEGDSREDSRDGATGSVGRHVVDRLLQEGADVRALTRRPGSADLPAAVEVVGGDLEQPEALAPMLTGVDRIYLVVSGDVERVVTLAKQAGVGKIVLLSSATAAYEGNSSGEYHRAAEVAVERSGLDWTHVRPGMFAGNLLDWAPSIKAEGVVRAPYDAAKQAPVHEFDVAQVAATALLDDQHNKKTYTLSGPESLTKTEQVAAIAKGAGISGSFHELPPEQWREQSGYPDYVADWLLALWAQAVHEPEPVLPDVRDVLGRDPKTLVEWAADHAADFH